MVQEEFSGSKVEQLFKYTWQLFKNQAEAIRALVSGIPDDKDIGITCEQREETQKYQQHLMGAKIF